MYDRLLLVRGSTVVLSIIFFLAIYPISNAATAMFCFRMVRNHHGDSVGPLPSRNLASRG